MEPRITRDRRGLVSGRAAGFTLIELMIVIAILSLLTLTATLGVNRPRTAQSHDWARFERIHAVLREQAVLGQEVLGLRLTPEGYRRLRRAPDGWHDAGPDARWTRPVRMVQPFGAEGVLTFLPSGQSTAVTLAFAGTGQDPETQCESDGWGPVTCATR